MKIKKSQGIVLVTALVVAFIMALWVTAALYRNSFMTSGVLYSHRKSESYFLAKRAVSRSLHFLNSDGGWATRHNSKASADDLTEGALCWVESSASGMLLKCDATVGSQATSLVVPIKTLDSGDTHLYSITPSVGAGPDVIAWKTAESAVWDTLPPIPGTASILSTTGTGNGEVYSVATAPTGETFLWRYRSGRGWIKMPELPAGVTISSVKVGNSTRLVAMDNQNSLQTLNLNSTLQWEEIPAPDGVILTDATLPVTESEHIYVAGLSTSGASIHHYDVDLGSWVELPAPEAAHISQANGEILDQSGPVPNFEGGVAVDPEGNVYAASNPPGEPSVIYKYATDGVGSDNGEWRVLPPVPNYRWDDSGSIAVDAFAENLLDLNADDEGNLWMQWQSPVDATFSTILVENINV